MVSALEITAHVPGTDGATDPAQIPFASLTMVVATPCEARPLCQHYKLRKCATDLWQGHGDNARLRLLLTGVGKDNATAAIHRHHSDQGAWLNVGIAWHKNMAPGTSLLAHSISSAGHSWFPQIVFKAPCATASLITVDQAMADYRHTGMVDMEAAGFYRAAIRKSSLERVHCLKIVSDGPGRPLTAATAKRLAPTLIHNAVPVIDAVCQELLQLNSVLTLREVPAELKRVLASYGHATASERLELQLRLRQWHHLLPRKPLPRARTVSMLLPEMRRHLQQLMHPEMYPE